MLALFILSQFWMRLWIVGLFLINTSVLSNVCSIIIDIPKHYKLSVLV